MTVEPVSPAASPSDTTSTTELIELLEQQRALFAQFHTFSRQQARLVADGQTEPLLTVLALRQKLIDQLSALNNELEPYRASWEQLYASLNEHDRQRVGELLSDTQSLLQRIVEQDERDRGKLEQWQSKVGHELKRIGDAGNALQAYGTRQVNPQARFTDRQG